MKKSLICLGLLLFCLATCQTRPSTLVPTTSLTTLPQPVTVTPSLTPSVNPGSQAGFAVSTPLQATSVAQKTAIPNALTLPAETAAPDIPVTLVRDFPLPKANNLTWSVDGKTIGVGSGDTINYHNPETGELERKFTFPYVDDRYFSTPDGTRAVMLIYRGFSSNLILIDLENGAQIKRDLSIERSLLISAAPVH